MIKIITTFILLSSCVYCRSEVVETNWALCISTQGSTGLVKKLESKNAIWPRLARSDTDQATAVQVIQALHVEWAKAVPSKTTVIAYAKLSRIALKADGWGNLLLADTCARLAIDHMIRFELKESDSSFFASAAKELPQLLLPSSTSIEALLKPAKLANEQRLIGKPLDELGFQTPEQLWTEEARMNLTARQVISSDNKTCLVARLAQTEILLNCHLPLLRDYLSRGGDLNRLTEDNATEYFSLMTPEPKYSCKWTNNRPIGLSNLIAILNLYRHPGVPNPILREFTK